MDQMIQLQISAKIRSWKNPEFPLHIKGFFWPFIFWPFIFPFCQWIFTIQIRLQSQSQHKCASHFLSSLTIPPPHARWWPSTSKMKRKISYLLFKKTVKSQNFQWVQLSKHMIPTTGNTLNWQTMAKEYIKHFNEWSLFKSSNLTWSDQWSCSMSTLLQEQDMALLNDTYDKVRKAQLFCKQNKFQSQVA